MVNERNAENIVRNILKNKGYLDDETIRVEEQQSDVKRIKNLLKNASKSGKGGKGFPEFIISFKDKPDEVVVVECKAAVANHESKNKEKYDDDDNAKKYAVDGALWYASYLKEDFNVTAIAFSGENEKEQKISSFLWLKKNYTFIEIPDKRFPTRNEVLEVTKERQRPFSQDDLIKKANDYNRELHAYAIPGGERCTLMSAILTALQHKPFRRSYKEYTYKQNKELIKSLLGACNSVLRDSGLDASKVEVIENTYNSFKTNNIFKNAYSYDKKKKGDEPNTFLRDFIQQIHKEIFPYIQNNEFDILGQFYTIFIRYAGSDKKIGLVLTPNHITDFFCEIANVNKDDVVFDPCCGTGGFLVSAMNYMLKDAGGDMQKKAQIRSEQLLGIEMQSEMFTHACSNMMMRGDGKSHIIYGDCFEEENKETIKEYSPTKVFLNPPYEKDNNAQQLEFLENALDCIEPNGAGIAICKMGCVVSNKKDVTHVKERLLQHHTLEAVFSMPTELFNPAASVPTAIIVFKAKQPHPKDYKSFFGYFKDDGFIVSKNKRTDSKNHWEAIKKQWLNAYMNKESVPGLSVVHQVTANDEWCAEAYMETDYDKLTEKDFIKSIKDYVAFQFLNNGI